MYKYNMAIYSVPTCMFNIMYDVVNKCLSHILPI